MADPAGTPSSTDILRRIYERQFRETAQLRKRILSLLPLSSVKSIFEPGCGTGLLGRQIMSLTSTPYQGMDIDRGILTDGGPFVHGDALKTTPEAGMYVSSFFFSALKAPTGWLKRIPTEYYAVISEYDYSSIREDPPGNLAECIRTGLRRAGLHAGHGGRLDGYFTAAGFRKLYGGDMETSFQQPDGEFLESVGVNPPGEETRVKWRIVWGIWQRRS